MTTLIERLRELAIRNVNRQGEYKHRVEWQAADELARLEARVGVLEKEAEWQPIETAPKDGGWIMLGYYLELGGGGGPEIAYWNKHYNGQAKWIGNRGPLNASGYFSPTHWRPLPNPPGATP